MSFLLDTNVISELGKPLPDPNVVRWCLDPEHNAIGIPLVNPFDAPA